jgi:hypothetical protein
MARSKMEVLVAQNAPYDALRRARHRELQHTDGEGLRDLLDDYFALADELEPGPPSKRAA